MATSGPLILTDASRFRPLSFRGHTRSPSRSPVRKSIFLAKEIDPFLSNLSPDSTLRALQATSTIAEGSSGQDVLAKSIADVTPEEREIGIRAAVAAQKLKQWRQELEAWSWPSGKDRGLGAGFLPPIGTSFSLQTSSQSGFLGYLPADTVKDYQDRIEDIRDGIEALELDDIKHHIFTAHVPRASPSPIDSSNNSPTTPTFAMMRDFTALITATVVQALPDLAHLTMLLDTWDIRLLILRQIPDIDMSIKMLRLEIEKVRSDLREIGVERVNSSEDFESVKFMLGGKVSSLGAMIDKLLDLLEDQEDTLPKHWLDSLESIENDYAAWVDEAKHAMTQHPLAIGLDTNLQTNTPERKEDGTKHNTVSATDLKLSLAPPGSKPTITTEDCSPYEVASKVTDLPGPETYRFPLGKTAPTSAMHSRKPTLSIEPLGKSHRRGASEISVADSTFSSYSEISTAEIIDARKTQVLASPKVSMVDNPFRASRDGLSWLSPPGMNSGESLNKPITLQRASTTSIQVFSKNEVRPVTLIRSHSVDMLSSIRYSPPNTPSEALLKLTGAEPAIVSNKENGVVPLQIQNVNAGGENSESMSKHPSLMVEPLVIKSRQHPDSEGQDSPLLPKRSSLRLVKSQSAGNLISSSPTDLTEPLTPTSSTDENPVMMMTTTTTTTTTTTASPRRKSIRESKGESLEDKIKDILTTMPTKIRLTDTASTMGHAALSSAPTTRSSTPVPTLTISPAKVDRSSRKAAPGDVRLFHLTKAGQGRDTPPVKLFVRAVGEHGERVMVRVGGGWADLAEYLREYSLHHGHRGLVDNQMEVASIPSKSTPKTVAAAPTPTRESPSPGKDASSRDQSTRRRFSLSSLSNLAVRKTRRNSQSKASSPEKAPGVGNYAAPPVPAIPHSYTMHLPTTITSTTNGTTSTNIISAPSYTPLGAAGPKSSSRRARASDIGVQNEPWVEGMMDKARAVSGSKTVYSPTVTTTTSVSSRTPSSRQVTSRTSVSPGTAISTPSSSYFSPKPDPPPARPKSRMSLADVSGIKRVFLRRKSVK